MAVCSYCGKQRSEIGRNGLCPVCVRLTAETSFVDTFERALEGLSGDDETSLQGELHRAHAHISRLKAEVILLKRALQDARAPSPDAYAKQLETKISRLETRNAELAAEKSRLEDELDKLERSVVSLRAQYGKLVLEHAGVTGDGVFNPSDYRMIDS